MKKILPLAIIFILVISLFPGCDNNKAAPEKTPEKLLSKDELDEQLKSSFGFVLVAQDEKAELYVDGATTEIAVKDKRNGTMWYSNPKDRVNDKIAEGANINLLNSQLELEYTDSTDLVNLMDNYSQSIALGQFEFCRINNGIRITYTIGQVANTILTPPIISKTRMEALLEKMAAEDREFIEKRYALYSLNTLEADTKDEIIKKYPIIEKHDVYVIYENIPDFIQEQMSGMFINAGYDENELLIDYSENEITPPVKPSNFVIPVEYTLDGGAFVATIPQIGGNTEFRLTDLKILRFFGAAGIDKNGYMFVPDGSGAVIDLNNGKTRYSPYKKQLYGLNRSTDIKGIVNIEQQCYLPVFGMKQDESAFIAIIEKGDGQASINSDISARNNSYNSVYPSFEITSFSQVQMPSWARKTGMNMYQEKPFTGPIQIRYEFLYNDDADYTGMARTYQKYLLDNDMINAGNFKDDIPFMLSLIGAIDYDSSVLGIPVKRIKALTSYGQAEEILDMLKKAGIPDISMKYISWANGGARNKTFSDADLISQLGGSKNFKNLLEFSRENDIGIYPEANFLYISKNRLFDSFIAKRDNARLTTTDYAYAFDFSLITKKRNFATRMFIVRPAGYHGIITDFANDYKKFGNPFLSIGSMGTDLNSDFDDENLCLREEAREIISEELDFLEQSGIRISSDGANAYTLKYLEYVNNMPMASSEYYITDKSIPFFQIVLHGILPYSNTPANFADDYRDSILKSLETGASPSFEWTYTENYEIKRTDYNYYNAYYKPWLEDAVLAYKNLNDAFKTIQKSKITEHEELSEKVFRTSFENGDSIYVNYNGSSVVTGDITIGAKDYKIVKGGNAIED